MCAEYEQQKLWYEYRLSNTGRFEHPARDPDRHFEGLEPARAMDYADRLATIAKPTFHSRNGRLRLGRHAAYIFHITKEPRKADLGSRSSLAIAHGNQHASW